MEQDEVIAVNAALEAMGILMWIAGRRMGFLLRAGFGNLAHWRVRP